MYNFMKRLMENMACGYKHSHNLPGSKKNMAINTRMFLCHSSSDVNDDRFHSTRRVQASTNLTKLSLLLKNLDLIDGRLVNVEDNSVVSDGHLRQRIHEFKSLARDFVGSPKMQQALKNTSGIPPNCFGKASEREPMTVNSLTIVAEFMNISAQQRKVVRQAICPQVTQHRMWTGAIVEILTGLKLDLEALGGLSPSKALAMGWQIVTSCLKFVDDAVSHNPNSASWMRLNPAKGIELPTSSRKWEDVLEMFNDLITCLRDEKDTLPYYVKLEGMKEGLAQIRDLVIDKNIKYKDTRLHESLVQKNLSKTLGHSSQCLFTLLQYYLYSCVGDIDVELRGGVYEYGGKDKFVLCMGKMLTSNEEKMLRNGMKQLNKALELFKFVWEAAKLKGHVELQGHIWYPGADEASLRYRGNMFFVHGIVL